MIIHISPLYIHVHVHVHVHVHEHVHINYILVHNTIINIRSIT